MTGRRPACKGLQIHLGETVKMCWDGLCRTLLLWERSGFLGKVSFPAWFYTLILAQIEDLGISFQVYSRWGAPLRAQGFERTLGGIPLCAAIICTGLWRPLKNVIFLDFSKFRRKPGNRHSWA